MTRSPRHDMAGGARMARGPAWPAEHDETAWRMYWNGRTYDEIAERLKRSHSAVYSRLRALKAMGGPGKAAQPSTAQRRACLCCRRTFVSTWKGNRVCAGCKTTEAYA